MTPIVSIALPVYNGGKTLRSAINSILLQTFKNWELLIFDDGSLDDTLLIANSFNDERIIVFSDGTNRGISFRLNQALSLCRGKFFARMDGDDIAFPDRIEKQIQFMLSNLSIDLLATRILIFDSDGKARGVVPTKEHHNDICSKPWGGFYMPHPTWFGKTEWFMKFGYNPSADRAEDQDLLFRAYQSSKYACLPDVLLAYREDPRTLKKMFRSRFGFFISFFYECIIRKQFYIAFRLILLQPFKILCDVINTQFNITFFRNKLLNANSELLSNWDHIWSLVNK